MSHFINMEVQFKDIDAILDTVIDLKCTVKQEDEFLIIEPCHLKLKSVDGVYVSYIYDYSQDGFYSRYLFNKLTIECNKVKFNLTDYGDNSYEVKAQNGARLIISYKDKTHISMQPFDVVGSQCMMFRSLEESLGKIDFYEEYFGEKYKELVTVAKHLCG